MQALRCAFYSFRSGTKKSISDGLSRESEQRRKDNAHLVNHSPLFSQSANEPAE